MPDTGRTVLEQVIDKALLRQRRADSLDSWRVLIVSNPINARTIDASREVEVFVNERYREGLSESVKVGIREAIRRKVSGVFLFLGDMPFISETTVESVYQKANQEPEAIIRPRYQNTPGFPLYFPARFFDQGMAITGDRGLQTVLGPLSQSLRWVETEDPFCVKDIDLPSDLSGQKAPLL